MPRSCCFPFIPFSLNVKITRMRTGFESAKALISFEQTFQLILNSTHHRCHTTRHNTNSESDKTRVRCTIVSPVIENCTDYFSKRGRISLGRPNGATEYETRFHYVFGISDLILSQFSVSAAQCEKLSSKISSHVCCFSCWKKNKHEIILISFFPFHIRVKWDLYVPLCILHLKHKHTRHSHVCVCVARAIERAIIIYSTNWIVKFKFIRNSSFPRGSHRRRALGWLRWLGSLAHLCLSSLFSAAKLDSTNMKWTGDSVKA